MLRLKNSCAIRKSSFGGIIMTKLIDGIVYCTPYQESDFIDFGFKHLECDSIITEGFANNKVNVVCYASEPKYNEHLQKLFNKQYKGKGYCILHHLSTSEVANVI